MVKRMQVERAAGASNSVYFSTEPAGLGIVTVNWNGWADTLECLEAIYRMRGFRGPVVVVDNGSHDESIELLMAWATGKLCSVPQSRLPQIEHLVIPPGPKPIPAQILEPAS